MWLRLEVAETKVGKGKQQQDRVDPEDHALSFDTHTGLLRRDTREYSVVFDN